MWDYVRRVYYKYKSGAGIPAYSGVGVASSSITNADQQVFVHSSNCLFKIMNFS